jgi:NAD(P)H-flavin reductase
MLAVICLSSVLWHVFATGIRTDNSIVAIIASLFWLVTLIYRIVTTFLRASSIIHTKSENNTVIRLLLKPDRPVNFTPEDYFHILLPGRPFGYRSYPAVAQERLTNFSQTESPEIIVNIPQDRLLSHQLSRMKKSEKVRLRGPFTQSLYLERHETVLLIAKGLGVYDILPLACTITKRKVGDMS